MNIQRMFVLHSASAIKLGSSPWHKYSSHCDADPQSFRSRRISSVNVDPEDPINTEDSAQIVLSSIASTFMVKHSVLDNFILCILILNLRVTGSIIIMNNLHECLSLFTMFIQI